jgi:hypothetical protein
MYRTHRLLCIALIFCQLLYVSGWSLPFIALLLMRYDVIFSKVFIGLTYQLRIFNIDSCEHISEHSANILGFPLNKFYTYRICCHKIVNSQCTSYLSERLQLFLHSRIAYSKRLGRRHGKFIFRSWTDGTVYHLCMQYLDYQT